MWNIQSFIHREQNINSLRLESVNSKWMRMSFPKKWHQFSSVQSLSCVWLFASSWTAAPRPPCMSPTAGVYPNPCPLSQWCHPTISSSVIPFSSCPQSFPHQQSTAAAPYLVSEVAPLSCPWPWMWGSSQPLFLRCHSRRCILGHNVLAYPLLIQLS